MENGHLQVAAAEISNVYNPPTTELKAESSYDEKQNGSSQEMENLDAAYEKNGSGLRDSKTASRTEANGGHQNGAPVTLTDKQKKKGLIQYLALCWTLFLAGWTDGSTGPLLPRIQSNYKVNFTIVSLMFVFASIGFLIGAIGNLYLTHKIGFGKLMAFGSILQLAAFIIQTAAPPFPVFVLAYVINGAGGAFQDAQANGFVAAVRTNPETKMGILHAAYGLGAFASPLLATQFAQLHRWSFHFLTSLGIGVVNTIALIVIFKFKVQDDCLRESGELLEEKSEPTPKQIQENKNVFKNVLRTPIVHLLAFFVLVYVGVEVSIGGWIVTYIINVRGGGPSSGYVSSGFFGGLTLGRVLLLPVNRIVGEWRVMFIYTIICIGLEFVVWFVPSLIGNAVAASFVGFLLGPMYPILMTQTSRILPRGTLTASIGWIAGFGFAGSAFFPFITGAISQKHGIKSLQPLLVALLAFMIVLWSMVPRKTRTAQ